MTIKHFKLALEWGENGRAVWRASSDGLPNSVVIESLRELEFYGYPYTAEILSTDLPLQMSR